MRFLLLALLGFGLLTWTYLRTLSEIPPEATATADSVHRWLVLNAIELHSVEAGSGFDDMQGIEELVGDARIVLLGEPTHGNREVYQLKHRIFEFLVENMGFNVLVMETPMPESFDVEAYLATGEHDAPSALAATQVWPWDTEEVLSMIEWIRFQNADPASPSPLKFYGFDMQSPERAARGTFDYLGRVDPILAAEAQAGLGHLAIPFSDLDAFGYRPVIARDAEASVQEAVDSVLAAFDANESVWAAATGIEDWVVARQHAQVLDQWVRANQDDGRRYSAVRDSAMAENIRWIVAREGPDARIAVWSHNAHVANAEAVHRGDGSAWAGRLLRQMFGDDLLIVGFLFNQGSFTALDAAEPALGLQTFQVGPSPEGTVESMFYAAGLRLAAIDLRDLPSQGTVADWFRRPRPTRYSWGDYLPSASEDYLTEYVFPEAFDALVYVKTTTPTRAVQPSDYGAFPVAAVPGNLNFEASSVGESPAQWVIWSKLRRFGFEVVTSDDRPFGGDRAAVVRRAPGDEVGEASGNLVQRINAAPYRGKRIRLRAAARADLPDSALAFVRLRIQAGDPGEVEDADRPPIFDSLDRHRVVSSDWRLYEITAEVPHDAGTISYGLFLVGAGNAWIDEISLEAEEP